MLSEVDIVFLLAVCLCLSVCLSAQKKAFKNCWLEIDVIRMCYVEL